MAASASGTSFVPQDDALVLERLRRGPVDQATREIRQLRRQRELNPQDDRMAALLARRLISKSRETSDPRYLGQAESVLAPWWDTTNAPVGILVLRATIRQSTHHFAPALADLDSALAIDPNNAQAWLTRATILQVVGDYTGARRACEPLQRLTSELISVTALSSVQSLTGEAEGAYQSLTNLLQRSPQASADQRIWAVTLLAEIAVRLGRTSEADDFFKQAFALGERDPYLLGAYADFLLDKNQPRTVIELLKDETRADSLLLRLALAEKAANDPKAGEHIAILKARFEASAQRGDKVHQREEARFHLHLLGEKSRALALALENFAVQREPADLRILLESALAVGDTAAKAKVTQFIHTHRLQDVQLDRLLRNGGEI
ncbi:MAG: tetratricopeptide repeat protein [Verrucomicrobiota bacterium]